MPQLFAAARLLALLVPAAIVLFSLVGVANPAPNAKSLGLSVTSPVPQHPSTTPQATFVNRTKYRRREWGLVTVPFPQGLWSTGKTFRIAGLPSDARPMGAPWPDGSIRLAQFSVAMDLPPSSETTVTVEEGAPQVPAFELSKWVTGALPNFSIYLDVGVPGIGKCYSRATKIDLVFQDLTRKVVHLGGWVENTDLAFDLWLTFFHDQDTVPVELRITCGNASSPQWRQDVDYVDLVCVSAMPHVRGAIRKGARYAIRGPTGPNIVRLLDQTHFYDAQALEWWGDLLFLHPTTYNMDELVRLENAAALLAEPLYGCAQNWDSSGAYGPFGRLGKLPPWVTDRGRGTTLARRALYQAWVNEPGGPWDDMPFGLQTAGGNTGAQHDFGIGKLLDIFWSGLPDGIEEARLNAGEEACRPVHHREADSTPLLSSNHPYWVAWGGRTHFSSIVSPDRLGKILFEPPADTHRWTGKDNQHWSSVTLSNAYMLTGSWSLRMELDNEVEIYLASQTVPSIKPGWSTNMIDSPRAVGRTLLTMSWNYLITGRTDLRDRVAARVRECIAVQWAGAGISGPVKTIALAPPDPRMLTMGYWSPWEDSLAIPGLEAAYIATGEPIAHHIATACAKSLITYGWRLTPQEIIIGSAIGWKAGGVPLTMLEYADPNWVLWSYDTGFSLWALPATKIARQFAIATQDADLYNRATAVMSYLSNARRAPQGGGFDDYMDWDCLD